MDQDQSIHMAALVGGTLTTGACILMLLSIINFRKLNHTYWRVVFALAFSDLGFAIAIMTGSLSALLFDTELDEFWNAVPCKVQGFIMEMLSIVNACYTLVICFMFYFDVIKKKRMILRWEVLLLVGPWIIGAINAFIPIFIPRITYVRLGGWCWIADDFFGRFFLLYFWVWIVLITIVVFYVMMWVLLRRQKAQGLGLASQHKAWEHKPKVVRKLLFYPLVYFIFWLPGILNRILQVYGRFYTPSLIEALFLPMIGFGNAIVYGFTSNVCQRPKHADFSLYNTVPQVPLPWTTKKKSRQLRALSRDIDEYTDSDSGSARNSPYI